MEISLPGMPKTKQQKKEIVDKIVEKIKRAKFLIFTSFSRRGKKGFNFQMMEKLKRNLKEADAEYVVLKKTLLDLALEKFSLSGEIKVKELEGSAAVLIGYGDLVEPIKILHKSSKENEALEFWSGLTLEDPEGVRQSGPYGAGKKIISRDLLVELANLPTREALLQRLYGAVRFPIWSLANVLSQIKN